MGLRCVQGGEYRPPQKHIPSRGRVGSCVRVDRGWVRGPLPEVRERRGGSAIVGRGAAGAAGARAKQPLELVDAFSRDSG